MPDTTAKYAAVHANLATHQLLAGEPVPITSGIVTFTPTSMSHDATTLYTACEVKGYLVDGVLRSHAYGGARGVQLIAPAKYNVQVSARSSGTRPIIINCIPITVQPGQEINLVTAIGGQEIDPADTSAPPSARRTAFRVVDAGNGLGRLIEVEEN